MWMSLAACAAGFVLDLMFGDPENLYHPVMAIGSLISHVERGLRRCLDACGLSERRWALTAAGGLLWVIVTAASFGVPFCILRAANAFHPALRLAIETFWCWQIPASRCLAVESRKVWKKLKERDLPGARQAVSMIVGRDTEALTWEGVTKAAVETVAENTSDGVTAPLLYMILGGAPLGFAYKAVNTMDSMLGYKNDTYLYFGRIPARMDDLFNYIPARITGMLMVAAAWLTGMDGKNAWKIYLRDRRKHSSPNAAQTEAACAGALDIQLAGDAVYFGKVCHKECIGDPVRPVEPEDIVRAGRLMYASSALCFLLAAGAKMLVLVIAGAFGCI